jgi:hypothetical protein
VKEMGGDITSSKMIATHFVYYSSSMRVPQRPCLIVNYKYITECYFMGARLEEELPQFNLKK